MTKKILSVLMIMIMTVSVFALTGCGSSSDDNADTIVVGLDDIHNFLLSLLGGNVCSAYALIIVLIS
jgi:hypothetical protein